MPLTAEKKIRENTSGHSDLNDVLFFNKKGNSTVENENECSGRTAVKGLRLEAATISDILYLFYKENLGKSQEILDNDVCNNALGLVSPPS